jgi:hypothetical protein
MRNSLPEGDDGRVGLGGRSAVRPIGRVAGRCERQVEGVESMARRQESSIGFSRFRIRVDREEVVASAKDAHRNRLKP